MKIILIILNFLSLSAFAGVRSVGKGGGYAEMQAISSHLRIKELTQWCTKNPTACGLTEKQTQVLTASLQTSFELKFDPTCSSMTPQVDSRNVARLPSCLLYENEASTVASPFNQIAAWVLTARLMATTEMDLETAGEISQLVFKNVNQKEQTLTINTDDGDFNFHALEIRAAIGRNLIFSVEGKTTTVNITEKIPDALNCATDLSALQVQVQRSTALEQNHVMFESNLRWACTEGSSWSGTLQVVFATEKGEVQSESIRVRVKGRAHF